MAVSMPISMLLLKARGCNIGSHWEQIWSSVNLVLQLWKKVYYHRT